ncbi:alpha-amylase family glycosyl hydrolase [Pseudomarimonas salicorniae]|uniref:Alpha-amylase family glycosyl hydrolase n=1 Tax=Pseudomarimonas salicorniae TaxID=2933270 RepID=A0ABT0GFI2_9GAMM|nr:alpha-amylase family glycosyl hydrolase [Lysobacter sp. CAU 1642]MCK7593302.1 alpha-amylase family glycosyl hydrolase [Lysobacter sp. CAU 1642]
MKKILSLALLGLLAGCQDAQPPAGSVAEKPARYYGTLEPFAAEALYFVLTDRFVNGDPGNDQREQGGAHPTFDIPLEPCDGVAGNIGYLGGDFRGLLDQADYIREMGFTSLWITPIVDNPDQAFTGGDEISCTSFLSDRGKSGYHGYWAINFHRVDEHLPSPGLGFAELTAGLRDKGLKTVLDIVGNHGSPAWSMPEAQPQFGQLFAADGSLLADHQNLPPEQLDPQNNPLHAFYNTKAELAQLSDLNPDNPDVVEYLVSAYLDWLDQGAHALRIDTIRHQPLAFWKLVAERLRERRPGLFLFGEAFDYEAKNIAPFTWPENGSISMLDFPLKEAMDKVFSRTDSDFAELLPALHLETGPYQNPYDLVIFYDNHDMPRMQASDEGFIDAHNWLFTARGIPVVYYGSEMGFMRGRGEHAGNRAYFGVEGIEAARGHVIRERLSRVARLREKTPALQRGLQLNLSFAGHTASFLRVLQTGEITQTALVLLNKGEAPARVGLPPGLPTGRWRAALGGADLAEGQAEVEVPGHDIAVFVLDGPLTGPDWTPRLDRLMQRTLVRPPDAKPTVH